MEFGACEICQPLESQLLAWVLLFWGYVFGVLACLFAPFF